MLGPISAAPVLELDTKIRPVPALDVFSPLGHCAKMGCPVLALDAQLLHLQA